MAPAEAPGVIRRMAWHNPRMTGTVTRAGRALVVCRGDAVADNAGTPFAVMQATLTAVYDRPGIQH